MAALTKLGGGQNNKFMDNMKAIDPITVEIEHSEPSEVFVSGDALTGESSTGASATHLAPGWKIIPVKSRVDASNYESLIDEIAKARESGFRHIALDLRSNKFLNLQAIQACVAEAREIRVRAGQFAIFGCPEKIKRYFEIYGSLDNILMVRTEKDLCEAPAGELEASTINQ